MSAGLRVLRRDRRRDWLDVGWRRAELQLPTDIGHRLEHRVPVSGRIEEPTRGANAQQERSKQVAPQQRLYHRVCETHVPGVLHTNRFDADGARVVQSLQATRQCSKGRSRSRSVGLGSRWLLTSPRRRPHSPSIPLLVSLFPLLGSGPRSDCRACCRDDGRRDYRSDCRHAEPLFGLGRAAPGVCRRRGKGGRPVPDRRPRRTCTRRLGLFRVRCCALLLSVFPMRMPLLPPGCVGCLRPPTVSRYGIRSGPSLRGGVTGSTLRRSTLAARNRRPRH